MDDADDFLDDFLAAHKQVFDTLEDFSIRHRQAYEQWRAEGNSRNKLIKADAVEICTIAEHEAWIIKSPAWVGMDQAAAAGIQIPLACGYCGYAVFREKPVVEPEFSGILTYVPVHGGITYYEEDELGHVYGFDTCHGSSGNYPIRDLDWIKNELLLMILGIEMAGKIEPEYLAADGDNERRAELVQPLVDLAGDLNFGTMLNILSGEL